MPRASLSRADRASNVSLAARDLPALLEAAQRAEKSGDLARAMRAWEAVEIAGATIHRQARLLAGKSRGG